MAALAMAFGVVDAETSVKACHFGKLRPLRVKFLDRFFNRKAAQLTYDQIANLIDGQSAARLPESPSPKRRRCKWRPYSLRQGNRRRMRDACVERLSRKAGRPDASGRTTSRNIGCSPGAPRMANVV